MSLNEDLADDQKRQAKELRIHGVGGSPGPRLLGLSDPEDVELAAEGVGTAFWRRQGDDSIEGYDWGALTSGSSLQPLWVLLLPFTLLNVAGWMHPRAQGSQARTIHAIVHALSALMTLSWVFWLSVISVDLLGYQWTRRLAEHPGIQGIKSLGLGERLVEPGASVQPIQYVGVVLGIIIVFVVMWAIGRIAGNTQKAFEQTIADPADPGGKWLVGENLTSASFFKHPQAAATLLTWHRLLIRGAILLVCARAAWQMSAAPSTLDFGHLLLACAALEFALILLLAIVSFPTGQFTLRVLKCGPAAAAILAFAIATAVFSGIILFVVKRLSEWPTLPDTSEGFRLVAGPELTLTDAWVPLLASALLIGTVWVLGGAKLGSADDLPDRQSPPGRPLDGVEDNWRQKVKKARGVALAARNSPWALAVVALMFLGAGLALAFCRIDTHGSLWPFDWTRDVEVQASFWWGAAAWLLAGLPLIVVGLMRASVKSLTTRRAVGILWDVLTFWPRRFHPLGVRPYSERAVVELRERLKFHVSSGKPVVVSAHSQGSILAFAALSSLPDDVLTRVGFVSYGSPITTLFGRAFPAYFGSDAVTALTGRLAGGEGRGWRNFHRDTDPIGGPVFETGSERDEAIPDPAITPTAADATGVDNIEPDRLAWVDLAGHSHYRREPALKNWVQQIKTEL